jgi:hypothetical protein
MKVPFVHVKHVCKRDIRACRNLQLAGFQADWAFVFIEPPQEITSHCIGSDEALERRYTIEVNDVRGIKGHELINVLCPACLFSTV